jgi:hypothetical protein
MIERLEALPGIARDVAPAVAVAVERELQRTIAAGTTPDGAAWDPKKQGGGQPLAGAAKAIRVTSFGTRILVTLTGPEALHHKGRARGGVKRQVIPVDSLPQPMAAKIDEAISAEFLRRLTA